MKIHYFQRYHEKENVATANTMLLLSRLYSYSSDKFFRFLKSEFFSDSFEPEIVFNLQEKSVDSIPDATITQEGFRLVVETKMSDWFYSDQLIRHLNSFGNEKYKVLITLAPEFMAEDKKSYFENKLKEYNSKQTHPVIHINTTFELIANAVQEVIDDRDYEMQDVLDDIKENVYYNNADCGFRPHDYLGLYKNKSIRAVGKVCARITAVETQNGMEYNAEFGELTEERKEKIMLALKDGDLHGYDLRTVKHRYFFVENFYETDFRKITPRAPMGARVFDLSQILETDKLPDTKIIAEELKTKSWS